jgi:hypothetical protein
MILDAQNLYSDAQALTGTSLVASTNIIDHGADRNLGLGTPMAVLVTIDVAAGGTTPTLTIAIQTDDNASFSSPTTVTGTTSALAAAALTAGAKFVYVLPADTTMERYSRVAYTPGGTSPTVTVTAALLPLSMIQNEANYADAITIS